MKTIVSRHKALCENSEPAVIVQAPIVCTLFGAFAEACLGYSLLSCGDLSITISVSKRKDNLVKVYKSNGVDKKRFALNALRFRKEDRWANYIKGVIAVFIKEGYKVSGMDFTISGDGLQADNISLSTSLATATALALNNLYEFKFSQQAIVRLVHLANTTFNGETCRVGDLLTVLNGRAKELVFFDHQHSTYEYVSFPFCEEGAKYKPIMFDSKVPSQAMIDENLYAHEFTVEAFRKLYSNYKDIPMRDIPETDITSRIIPLDEKYRQVCGYVLRETKLTYDALQQLRANEPIMYGRLMNRAQVDLRDKLEVTCPEVDWLTKRASEIEGCKGAKLVFNGNSGAVLVLISEEALPKYIERLDDYGHIFGFNPTWSMFVPTEGAKILYSIR